MYDEKMLLKRQEALKPITKEIGAFAVVNY